MELLKVGLCFNLRSEGAREGPEDAQAEYDSWSTVSALAEALSFHGACRVVPLPFGPDLPLLVARARPDVVFNIAEGSGGRSRESLAPAVFEVLGVPYTGSDPVALGVAMDKSLARSVVAAAGVAVAWGAVAFDAAQAARISTLAPLPAFVKPVAEGSSKGVRRRSRVDTAQGLVEQAVWVIEQYHQPALIEEFLPGREFSVGLVGNGDLVQTLPVLEVRPLVQEAEPGFVYCYHTKSGNLERFLCPAPVDAVLAAELAAASKAVFGALSLRDVARVDFRLGADGRPRFLEVNPLPGLSAASLLTAQGQAAGLDLQGLVGGIMASACRRWVADPGLDACLRQRLTTLLAFLEQELLVSGFLAPGSSRAPAVPGPQVVAG